MCYACAEQLETKLINHCYPILLAWFYGAGVIGWYYICWGFEALVGSDLLLATIYLHAFHYWLRAWYFNHLGWRCCVILGVELKFVGRYGIFIATVSPTPMEHMLTMWRKIRIQFFAVGSQLSLENFAPKIEHCVIDKTSKTCVVHLEAF